MFALTVDRQLSLHFLTYDFAEPLFRLVDGNREYLSRWFPWPEHTKEVADTRAFIASQLNGYVNDQILPLAICADGNLVGMIDLHNINREQKSAEMGYWLAEKHQGQGFVSRCARVLLDLGFQSYDLEVMRIDAQVDNGSSRAVAERLGFSLDGIIRARLYRQGQGYDHALYSLLRHETPA